MIRLKKNLILRSKFDQSAKSISIEVRKGFEPGELGTRGRGRAC